MCNINKEEETLEEKLNTILDNLLERINDKILLNQPDDMLIYINAFKELAKINCVLNNYNE